MVEESISDTPLWKFNSHKDRRYIKSYFKKFTILNIDF